MSAQLRWMRLLAILTPAIAVGAFEVLSDTVLDDKLHFPLDAIVVTVLVLVFSSGFTFFAFQRISGLGEAIHARNVDLEGRNASARALYRVSVAIAALDDLDRILEAIVTNARDLLNADVSLLILERDDGESTLRASAGGPGVLREPARPDGGTLDRWVEPGARTSGLEAPLRRGEERIGTLAVGTSRPGAFGPVEAETLAALANQAAIAIERDRQEERLRDLAVVDERDRIARELHDGLAQVLGYVNTKSQAVEGFLDAGRIREARVHLEELAAAARSVYVDLREQIVGLRSPIGPQGSLVEAIEALARTFADAAKLAVRVQAGPDARHARLSPEAEAQVFRVVQEALTNVRKHAAARRVVVALELVDDRLSVAVTDDGRGIGPDPDDDRPHYGLRNMRERASALGGEIEWRGLPAGGTEVRLVIPVERDVPARAATAAGEPG